MKQLFLAAILFIILMCGCFHTPDNVRAQITAENFLDTLYQPNKVQDKSAIGYITIKDYLDTSIEDYLGRPKQKMFRNNVDYFYKPTTNWDTFAEKAKKILSKGNRFNKESIIVEMYKVNNISYSTAFFVDSTFEKIFAVIRL